DGPGDKLAAVEDRSEHGPVADVSVAGVCRVVDEDVSLADVSSKGADHEAKRWAKRADVHGKAVEHRQDLGPCVHHRTREILGTVKDRVSCGCEDRLGHL